MLINSSKYPLHRVFIEEGRCTQGLTNNVYKHIQILIYILIILVTVCVQKVYPFITIVRIILFHIIPYQISFHFIDMIIIFCFMKKLHPKIIFANDIYSLNIAPNATLSIIQQHKQSIPDVDKTDSRGSEATGRGKGLMGGCDGRCVTARAR